MSNVIIGLPSTSMIKGSLENFPYNLSHVYDKLERMEGIQFKEIKLKESSSLSNPKLDFRVLED